MSRAERILDLLSQKLNPNWDRETKDLRGAGIEIQNYIKGEPIPETCIQTEAGGDPIEYRRKVLENVIKYTGLSFDEVEAIIKGVPDHIEGRRDFSDSKLSYCEALTRLRNSRK